MSENGPVMIIDESAEGFLQLSRQLGGGWTPLWAPTMNVMRWWMQFLSSPVTAVMVRVDQLDERTEERVRSARRETNAVIIALMEKQPSAFVNARLEQLGVSMVVRASPEEKVDVILQQWTHFAAPANA